jgi:hypothetical protein
MQREIEMIKTLKEHKNTQKKTPKEIRVMEKINEKKRKMLEKNVFVTLHKRKAST